jgi:hypothetical protein
VVAHGHGIQSELQQTAFAQRPVACVQPCCKCTIFHLSSSSRCCAMRVLALIRLSSSSSSDPESASALWMQDQCSKGMNMSSAVDTHRAAE